MEGGLPTHPVDVPDDRSVPWHGYMVGGLLGVKKPADVYEKLHEVGHDDGIAFIHLLY